MTRYEINFACSLPNEPGCGCPDNDFHTKYGFEGTAEEAVRLAEEISWERYYGDFRWWIVEDPTAAVTAIAREPSAEKPRPRESIQEKLEKSEEVFYRTAEELDSFLLMPSYTTSSGSKSLSDLYSPIYNKYFNLYNNNLLVDSGKSKPGSSTYPHNIESSIFTLKEMIYRLNLAYSRKLDSVLMIEEYFAAGIRQITEINVFPFQENKIIMAKYAKEHEEFKKKKEEESRNLCERLKSTGSTIITGEDQNDS